MSEVKRMLEDMDRLEAAWKEPMIRPPVLPMASFKAPKDPKEGDLRVWWISNLGTQPLHVYVDSIPTAKVVLKVLAAHDLHLGDDLVATNTGGLEVLEATDDPTEGEWSDWEDEDGNSLEYLTEVEDES